MNRRRRLGQHFLRSPSTARKMAQAACIRQEESVLEIGTGRGILTKELCALSCTVDSYEADPALCAAAQSELGGAAGLTVRCGDGYALAGGFDVMVSSIPYSQSRRTIEWLAQKEFSRAVLLVQSEFAAKLAATSGGARRAVSVIAQHAFEIKRIATVSKSEFSPPPKVDSAVILLRQQRVLNGSTIRAVNLLFSSRRKTLKGTAGAAAGMRIDELSCQEAVRAAENAQL